MRRTLVTFSLLFLAILVAPTASPALEGVGFAFPLVVVNAPGEVSNSIFVARSVAPVSLIGNFDVYDANDVFASQALFVMPAGATIGQLIVFSMAQVLTQTGLASALYTANFYDSLLAAPIFLEHLVINPFPNVVTARLPGPGNAYGYTTSEWALTLLPETGTGIQNRFLCHYFDRDNAAFWGLAPVAPGSLGASFLFTTAGQINVSTFTQKAVFAVAATALNAAASAGGTLNTVPPGNFMNCVTSINFIPNGPAFGMYTITP